jgi:colicin import membrane protein
VDQAEFELQLKVWKDLAISNQVLIKTATDALGLDPDCSRDVLKRELEIGVKKIIDAEASVGSAQAHAGQAIAVMEKKMAEGEKARNIAEAQAAAMLSAKQESEKAMAVERDAHFKAMKNINAQITEKERTVKAINKALADTPENVVKKLKTLKKQKLDETSARKVVEGEAATLRKEKRSQEQRISEFQAALEESAKLVTQHRELHELCTTLHGKLEPLIEDKADLPALTKLDDKGLEAIEEAAKKAEKTDKAAKKKK